MKHEKRSELGLEIDSLSAEADGLRCLIRKGGDFRLALAELGGRIGELHREIAKRNGRWWAYH